MKKYKADVVFDIGSRYDEASNARTLFEALRLFDEKKWIMSIQKVFLQTM